MARKQKELRENFFDDIIGCVVQSLNDGFADYCFSQKQLSRIVSRLRAEGTTSVAYMKVVQKDGNIYYHLIPIKLYKKYNGKDMPIIKFVVNVKKIPSKFKCVYSKGTGKLTIQDYDSPLNMYNLLRIIQFTNNENE